MKLVDAGPVPKLAMWLRPWGRRRWLAIGLLAAAIVASTAFVYLTGGIKFVFSHSMYLPILVAGGLFGPIGGALAGMAGGLTLGPYMPIDTVTGEMQEPLNWLFRAVFFMLVGGVTGGLVDVVTRLTGRDPVSGAPGLGPLMHDLHELVDRQKRGEAQAFTLLLLRLDNHREITRTFGVETGTHVLRGFVDRVATVVAASPVYHVSGESFAVTLPRAEVEVTLAGIRDEVAPPVEASGVPVYVNLTIGRVDCPEHSQLPEMLIQQATIAADLAIGSARGIAAYDRRLDTTNRANQLLLSDLAEALDDGQLRLYYQPQVALDDTSVVAYEALVRWQHPQHGLLLPDRFVPQAEKTHLVHRLARWCLETALADVRDAEARGDSWRVAVNLSARNLHDRGLLTTIDESLLAADLEPDRLAVELTESLVILFPDEATRVLGLLRDRGIEVAIDDFGKGSTSLSHLKRLPASSLKIDRGFIEHVAMNTADQRIVEAIVLMAHRFDMQVVAEGVEDDEALSWVRQLGCDVAQGTFISDPRPASAFSGFSVVLS